MNIERYIEFRNQPERFKGDLFYANPIYYLKAYDTAANMVQCAKDISWGMLSEE